jgi:GH24 family phage-related lysozyme (muramidase)
MSKSRKPGSQDYSFGMCLIPPRTPGSLGLNDQGDPTVTSWLGDTPGSLGFGDWACMDLPPYFWGLGIGAMCRAVDGTPLAAGAGSLSQAAADRKSASSLSPSVDALTLLKGIESLHLKPYDDQTGKDITAWVQGATIGYGHLIAKGDWDKYKAGFKEAEADTLFDEDLAPFVSTVGAVITALISQSEFDALVILAFNIGRKSFTDSSVAKLVNDPAAKTSYASLELAWKAWNTSQGKVMKGLDNRRQAEWNIYTKGVYARW